MKILHILNEIRSSGAEIMLLNTAEFWQRNKLQSHILSTGENLGHFSKNLEDAGYTLHHIPLKNKLKYIIKLNKLIKFENFDIIHIHSEGASLYSAIAAKLAHRNKIIRTVHHIWPKRRVLPYFKRKLFRFISNKLLKVIAVSNSISGQKNEEDLFNSRNLLIPNWYDSNKFKPVDSNKKISLRKKYNVDSDFLIVTSLGGNWIYKNYDLIIQAMVHLDKNTDIRYFQIGTNNESLKDLAKKLNISDKIYFWGEVSDVIPFLKMSDYYIMPSSEEGFGNSAIEALSVGLIPILSDVKALSDFKYYYPNEIIWIKPEVEDIVYALKQIEKTNNKAVVDDYERRMKQYCKTIAAFGLENGPVKYLQLYKYNEL